MPDAPVSVSAIPRAQLYVRRGETARCFCGAPLGQLCPSAGTRLQLRCTAYPCHRFLTVIGAQEGAYITQSRADRRKTTEADNNDYRKKQDPSWPHSFADVTSLSLADLRLYLEAVTDAVLVETRAYEADRDRLAAYVEDRAARERAKVDAFRAAELRAKRAEEEAARAAAPVAPVSRRVAARDAAAVQANLRESEIDVLRGILKRRSLKGLAPDVVSKVNAMLNIGTDAYLLKAADLLGVRELLSFGDE